MNLKLGSDIHIWGCCLRVCSSKYNEMAKKSVTVIYINKLCSWQKVAKYNCIWAETHPIRWTKPVSSKQ